MYSITTYKDGKFEIYNSSRKKIVYKGSDKMMESKADTTHEFASCDALLSTISGWMSMASFRKITRMLRP